MWVLQPKAFGEIVLSLSLIQVRQLSATDERIQKYRLKTAHDKPAFEVCAKTTKMY